MGKVLVKGMIREIYDQGPETVGAKWWPQDYCTTLRTSTSGTFYMFFPSKQELERLRFNKTEKVVVRGFLLTKEVRCQKKKILTNIERASESDNVDYE